MAAEATEQTSATEFIKVAFDLEVERGGLLGLAGEYLQVGRKVIPMVCFYRGPERILMVTSRNPDEGVDEERAIWEILNLFPTLSNVEAILLCMQVQEVTLVGGEKSPAVVVILVKRSGAEAMVYPYYYNEEGKCVFDLESLPDPDAGRPYSDHYSHAFAMYAHMWQGIGSVRDVLDWLYHLGHEVQFFGEWGLHNIDAKSALPVSERG